ncbi:MAG: hypothetical protein BWZ10_03338 [candidate division BRC1 bacterium ADurb.BinA364]|nr:MAG: hypothetical protein BWZ10_03338 [candidate division BRC1 bacterium ADurb.BinA364]
MIAGLLSAKALSDSGTAWAQGDAPRAIGAAAGAALGALSFIFFHRYITMLLTCGIGAWMLGKSIRFENPLVVPASAFTLGLLFQFGIVRKLGLARLHKPERRKRRASDEDEE